MWLDLTLGLSAYNSPIISPRVLGCETDLYVIMGWESSDVVGFDLGSVVQVKIKIAKHKNAYNSFIIGPTGLGCETDL